MTEIDSSPKSSDKSRAPILDKKEREALLALIFIIPSFIIIIVFGIYPVFKAGYISLHKWSIIKESFVGFRNYANLLKDKAFWNALTVTVFYVVATVPLTMIISLVLAYLLFKPIRFRPFFRTLYFLPYVTSLVPAAMVWQWIFNYQSGVLNYVAGGASQSLADLLRLISQSSGLLIWIVLAGAWLVYLIATASRRAAMTTWLLAMLAGVLLAAGIFLQVYPTAMENTIKQLDTFFPVRWLQEPRGIFLYLGKKWGFKPPSWLQGPSMALIAVSIVSMWHFVGYDIVIYMAGLFNVPPELHEAARIDGASEGQIFWLITFPLLSPTSFFLLIISTIGAFRAFTMFYILTAGGPLNTTTSVTYYIYDRFYSAAQWGYASAVAFVLFGIILVMTLINRRLAEWRIVYQ